jgi:hypothetical protein
VVADEGLPMLIAGPFDRFANLLSVECHGEKATRRPHKL